MQIRAARDSDHEDIWAIVEPILREGETYALPRDWTREAALAWWFSAPHHCFVAEDESGTLGISFLQPNQKGGGAHVCNCGFMIAVKATGRGVARALCIHALGTAKSQGFLAMQFNFVVSSNTRAIALWESLGFQTLTRLPKAFDHPRLGFIDALVMFKEF